MFTIDYIKKRIRIYKSKLFYCTFNWRIVIYTIFQIFKYSAKIYTYSKLSFKNATLLSEKFVKIKSVRTCSISFVL